MFSWRRSAFSFRYILNFLNCTNLRTADVFPVVASLTPKNKLETRAEKNGCSRRLFITGKKKKWKTLCFVACSRCSDQGALIVMLQAKRYKILFAAYLPFSFVSVLRDVESSHGLGTSFSGWLKWICTFTAIFTWTFTSFFNLMNYYVRGKLLQDVDPRSYFPVKRKQIMKRFGG